MNSIVRSNVLTLNVGTPLLLTIFVLKFEQVILLPVDKTAGHVANCAEPDLHFMAFAISDLVQNCLLVPVCPNI